jgi:hypothetical protein
MKNKFNLFIAPYGLVSEASIISKKYKNKDS